MKLIDFLQRTRVDEAPLVGYEVLPRGRELPGANKKASHRSDDSRIRKDLQTATQFAFRKTLSAKLEDIPYPIYIYQMNIDRNRNSNYYNRLDPASRDLVIASANPDYYHLLTPVMMARYYSPEIAKQVKFDPSACTLVYSNRTSFPTSTWGFVHDFVHAITLSEEKLLDQLDKTERLIAKIFEYAIKKVGDGSEHWKINTDTRPWRMVELFSAMAMTTGSARSGILKNRPEEISTELMTQWIFSKKIEFDWDKISKSKKLDAALNEGFNKYAPKIEALYWNILMNAEGKAYYTS